MSELAAPVVDARAGSAGTRIDLDDVCRWFQVGSTVVKAVDQVNLHVDETAFVVVLGASGSGKTTLLMRKAQEDARAGMPVPDEVWKLGPYLEY